MKRIDVDDEIVLHIPTLADADPFFAAIDRNRDYLSRWVGWVPETQSVETVEGVIARWMKEADGKLAFQYVIEYRQSIVGVLSAKRFEGNRDLAELGYWLSEDAQGNGIITRSISSLIQKLFEDGINRIEIRIAAPNAKSRAVAERLGFTLERCLRNGNSVGDRNYDETVYALLA